MFLAGLVGLAFIGACRDARQTAADGQSAPPPLGDSLVSIFEEIVSAAVTDRSEDFKDLLASSEAERLGRISRGYGGVSLGWCLERQLGSWPNLDTLTFEDLVHKPPYARVAFTGAAPLARYDDRVRYTFLLFRQSDSGWRLAGVSSLEKDRYDQYGTELGYLETELPGQLRFPRLF